MSGWTTPLCSEVIHQSMAFFWWRWLQCTPRCCCWNPFWSCGTDYRTVIPGQFQRALLVWSCCLCLVTTPNGSCHRLSLMGLWKSRCVLGLIHPGVLLGVSHNRESPPLESLDRCLLHLWLVKWINEYFGGWWELLKDWICLFSCWNILLNNEWLKI